MSKIKMVQNKNKKEIGQDMKDFMTQLEGLSPEMTERILQYIGRGITSGIVNTVLCREGAKMPDRKKLFDAGADLYVPVLTEEERTIPAGKTKRVPMGIKVELPEVFAGFNIPRSGTSANGLTSEIPPIDSNYRGEIHAILTNNSDKDIVVEVGDRVCQLVILPVCYAVFRQVDELTTVTERGEDAFNSTGK